MEWGRYLFIRVAQKLDGLLKSDIENGIVRIEKTQFIGADDKEYDI